MSTNKPKFLILTGPQGSGNHLFVKLLGMHPAVEGWPMLRDEWQGHHQEPFADAWEDPKKLNDRKWTNERHYLSSISCPYIKSNTPHIPKYAEFITEAKKHCDVVIGIIGRDRNILDTQQKRLRKEPTTALALQEFKILQQLAPIVFLSQELFFLYGADYINAIGSQIGFPVLCPSEVMKDYLKVDSNKKYIQYAEGTFDEEVKRAYKES